MNTNMGNNKQSLNIKMQCCLVPVCVCVCVVRDRAGYSMRLIQLHRSQFIAAVFSLISHSLRLCN